MTIEDGTEVKVHYTGTLDDGEVFDTSKEREPLTFTIGQKQVIPGFENAVKGLDVGDEVKVRLEAADAYGERRDELEQRIPKEEAPEGIQKGMQVMLQAPNGAKMPATITEVTDEEVVIDLNHPLAGKALTFELKREA